MNDKPPANNPKVNIYIFQSVVRSNAEHIKLSETKGLTHKNNFGLNTILSEARPNAEPWGQELGLQNEK